LTLRTWFGRHPGLFNVFFRALNEGEDRSRLVEADTEIVFDGFPRSGNSFSANAFYWAQEREVKIAWGVHSPSQIIGGVRGGKPVCVLIRQPEEAINALLRQVPHFIAKDLLCAYRIYYESLLPHHEGFIIGVFDEVIRDFGRVIDRINQRFGSQFRGVDLSAHRAFSKRFLIFSQDSIMRDKRIQGQFERAIAWGAYPKGFKRKLHLSSRGLSRCTEIYQQYLDLAQSS
jgi:hypothetical protein